AELRAGLCAAKAILDYNRLWRDVLDGFVEPDPTPNDADLTSATGAVSRVPVDPTDVDPDQEPDSDSQDSPPPSSVAGDEPDATSADRIPERPARTMSPVADDQLPVGELFAVYEVHSAVTPKFSGSNALIDMQRWFSGLNSRSIRIASKPSGEISFRLSGESLQDYRQQLQQVGGDPTLVQATQFRKGHRYHQIGRVSLPTGQQMPYVLLLVFKEVTDQSPDSPVPVPIRPLTNDWWRRLQLSQTESLGAWSVDDGKGGRLALGPLVYSGETGWSSAARQAAADFMKQFGLGFLQQ
ncbi:MAG: hypothetical protein AAGA03_15755, partial [Planctomycetota bacterium]